MGAILHLCVGEHLCVSQRERAAVAAQERAVLVRNFICGLRRGGCCRRSLTEPQFQIAWDHDDGLWAMSVFKKRKTQRFCPIDEESAA
jgi:hypothetical protein